MQKITLILLLATATAIQAFPDVSSLVAAKQVIPIVSQVNELNPDGSFKNSYQSGDGTAVDQTGYVKQVGSELAQVVVGQSSYYAPDGTLIQTGYTADENGYKAVGAHLPTPPPVDPVILKSLQFLATSTEKFDRPSY